MFDLQGQLPRYIGCFNNKRPGLSHWVYSLSREPSPLRFSRMESAEAATEHPVRFVDEELVGRELEAFAAMRLLVRQLEVTVHTRWRDSRFARDHAHTPVRRAVCWPGVQGLCQLSQPFVVSRSSSIVRGLPGRTLGAVRLSRLQHASPFGRGSLKVLP